MGLLKYTIRRIIFLVFVLIGVTITSFLISHAVPGDPLVANLGQRAMSDKTIVEAYQKKWGLDKPLYQQYLVYMKNLLKGDMGISIRSKRPVTEELKMYFPATFELATFATIIAIVTGLIFGVVSATKRNSFYDQIIRVISIVGVSLPAFWLALICLYIFYFKLGIFPGSGRLGITSSGFDGKTGFMLLDSILIGDWGTFKDAAMHLVLPGVVLASATMGIITRTVRSSMLDVLSQDYLRTARAKGLSDNKVVYKHALSNAMLPTVTIFGLSYGNLLGGTVLIETIFDWPGLGWYAYNSAVTLDFPSIMGVTILIAVIYSIMNLVVDLAYGLLDPRVRYQ